MFLVFVLAVGLGCLYSGLFSAPSGRVSLPSPSVVRVRFFSGVVAASVAASLSAWGVPVSVVSGALGSPGRVVLSFPRRFRRVFGLVCGCLGARGFVFI